MKKLVLVLVVLALAGLCLPVGSVPVHAMTGSGTVGDPYIISTQSDLVAVGTHLAAYYKLGGNLSLTGDFTPLALGSWFSGNFNGDNYTISGLTIDEGATGDEASGLFAWVENATISNVNLTSASLTVQDKTDGLGLLVGHAHDSNIFGCSVVGIIEVVADTGSGTSPFVGGLVGHFDGGVSNYIENCDSTIGITVSDESPNVGGLVGLLTGGTVENSWSSGTITDDTVGGLAEIGGFVGDSEAGDIISCFSNVDTAAQLAAAGFVENNYLATISQCYALGSITSSNTTAIAGGFVLSNYFDIENCFSRVDLTFPNGDDIEGFAFSSGGTATLTNCYYAGTITAPIAYLLVGFYYNVDPDVTNCFYDSSILGGTPIGGTPTDIGAGTPTVTASMKTESTFTGAGWDFSSIWYMDSSSNDGYPSLPVLSMEVSNGTGTDPIVYYKRYGTSYDDYGGQTFTLTDNFQVIRAKLKLAKGVGGSPGYFTVSIWSCDQVTGLPIGAPGTALTSDNYDGDTIPESPTWVTFTFNPSVILAPGKYAVVLYMGLGGSYPGTYDYIRWYRNNTPDVYAGGEAVWYNQWYSSGWERLLPSPYAKDHTFEIWGAPALPGSAPGAPTNLTIAGSTSSTISLTWVLGAGSTKTMVRRKTSTFTGSAADITEGTLVYYGTDDNCTAVGLSYGTHYYFRAWGWTS